MGVCYGKTRYPGNTQTVNDIVELNLEKYSEMPEESSSRPELARNFIQDDARFMECCKSLISSEPKINVKLKKLRKYSIT